MHKHTIYKTLRNPQLSDFVHRPIEDTDGPCKGIFSDGVIRHHLHKE